MTEPLTTYTVKGKNTPTVWEFKYDLKGVLKDFKLLEGELNEQQQTWLFHKARFPYYENSMKSWQKAIKNFEVIVGKPDLDFTTFYNLYRYKVGKLEAQRAWKKLNKADQLKAIKQIKAYEGFLHRKRIEKVHPATYLNKRRFDDEFNSIH